MKATINGMQIVGAPEALARVMRAFNDGARYLKSIDCESLAEDYSETASNIFDTLEATGYYDEEE